MISINRIKLLFLAILILLFFFSTDTYTDVSGSILESVNDVKNNNTLEESGIFASAIFDASYIPPPDTNLTLKQLDSLRADSIRRGLIKIDSTKFDSTARLKNFQYVRKPNKFLNVEEPRKLSFFAYPSQRYLRRTVELDSTGTYVVIREFIADAEVRNPLRIPLEQYIEMKLTSTERNNWEGLGYNYQLTEGKDDLGQLFSDITSIEIPLPSVSFLSIFGPPKISLKINGAVDIHGAWRNETTEGVTASLLGNTRNEPDFNQQVQINVNGTIGDKLTIAADWNTERTFEYENQLKLHYKGYEDEIIQSVEAGNVSLQTSPLVGGGEALFGIKALFQLGPFSLTALASQKKSEVEEVSVSGGSQKNEFEIHAYDYSQNHYFVDLVYADEDINTFGKYFRNANPLIVDSLIIREIEVWKSTSTTIDNANERRANAYIDLPKRVGSGEIPEYDNSYREIIENPIPGRSTGGRFRLLEDGVDYIFNKYAGIISFKSQISKEDAIAIAFRYEGPAGQTDNYYGEFLREVVDDTAKVMVLKLVKPQDLQPGGTFRDAWTLQLKNIYPVGGRDVKKEGFTLDIKYEEAGQDPINILEGKNLLEAFELDKSDESGTGGPDGAFDWEPGRTIFTSTGEIIFPFLQPFGKDFPLEDPEKTYQAVYDTSVTFAKQDKARDKFIIVGEYSADATSVYNIGFNAVENSVKVTLDGRALQEGVDYSVDYNLGQVIIRNEAALVTGANLKITFEKNDLFQLASKTLLGLRGIYDFSDETKFGFSFLNLNQTTLSDKVRIGEEPLNNSIYGFDFQTGVDLPFLTKGLDYLISTKEMSSISLKGEVAYMNPDPNTKKSKISSDNGESIAYIDDFEGAKRTIPVGVSYTGWRDISVPDDIPGLNNSLSKLDKMAFKAKSYWFNILPSDVVVEDIWGDRKKVGRNDDQITVLDYVFNPIGRGTYNWDPNLANPIQNWGGMMRPLSSSAGNLVEENIEYIEFWLKIRQAPEDAKLFIDLGQISEDIIPDGSYNTEDEQPYNDNIDEGEDTGLDGLTNAQEIERFTDFDGSGDPSGDDFVFSLGSGDYTRINGTEGNAKLSDAGRFPDSEDMGYKNYEIDKVNSYFRYEVPIDTSKIRNRFISGGGDNDGWYQFRVPLREFASQVGSPSFTLVEVVRVWVTGVEEPVHIRLAEMNLVGNQWQKVLVPGKVDEDDKVLKISTINYEDNPEYNSPPGVKRERDRTNTEEVIYKNEQSLQLVITDLEDGDRREIVKYLYSPLDVFSYKEMKLFIHGELNSNPGSISHYVDEHNYGAEMYFRFGTDTLNYYEYRQPVEAGWNEIAILFDNLTAIKEIRTDPSKYFSLPVEGKEGHFYGVRGLPTLTKVNFFSFGIENPNQEISSDEIVDKMLKGESVSGELWVNELRVLGADDTPGWAYSASTQFKLADLVSVNLNASQSDPYFHKLNQRFGNRVDDRKWSGAVNFNALKLLPWDLTGSNLSVNYSHSESIAKPLYKPGTDINVDQAVEQEALRLEEEQGLTKQEAETQAEQIRTESQTINVSDTWSLSSIRFKLPSKSWYAEDIINNISFAFNYNQSYSRSPSQVFSKSWVWNGSGKYSLNFSKDNYFFAADIPLLGYLIEIFEDYKNVKIYFSPQSFNTSLSASRKQASSLSRTSDAAENIQRDFTAKRDFGFSWKITEGGLLNLSTSYNVDVSSSYAHLLAFEDLSRPEKDIWNDIFRGPIFGKDYNYTQSFDLKTSPELPSLWDLKRYLNLTMGYSANYRWTNNFKQEDLGIGIGFSNSIRAGITLKWQSLTAPLFAEEKVTTSNVSPQSTGRNTRGRGRNTVKNIDEELEKQRAENETEETESDTLDATPGTPLYTKAFSLLKLGAKWIFFDYESISMNFSQSNSVSSSGIKNPGTGFSNFWGWQNNPDNGPSRLFMLGLSSDVGARAPNGNLSDNFTQKNTVDFKTSRPLWEDAKISLDWQVGWGLNKNTRITTDDNGTVFVNEITSTGNLDRSFMYLPVFFSNAGIKAVNDLYQKDPNKNIANAFVEGFESMPLLSQLPIFKDVAKYVPRANWRFDWRGLEKLSFIEGFAKSISLNHAYQSGYSEGWKVDTDGRKQIQTQRINYGFSPLAGINVTFDEMWGGNLTGSVKYSTKTSYDLGITTKNITESFSKDINFTASFSKSGFSLPLFGLDLKNDIEMSLSYTSAQNSVVIFEMGEDFNEKGEPQDGTLRTIIEPRIKYTLSSKVTLSIFYKRTSVEPEGSSRIPATTTNEAGLDVHISIQ
ncbi:MAG: cell surface protein SprA [Ignavibacteriales bacterium]|nr:cell surface protein SprA [Ignavibacteriales bacterium]